VQLRRIGAGYAELSNESRAKVHCLLDEIDEQCRDVERKIGESARTCDLPKTEHVFAVAFEQFDLALLWIDDHD